MASLECDKRFLQKVPRGIGYFVQEALITFQRSQVFITLDFEEFAIFYPHLISSAAAIQGRSTWYTLTGKEDRI